MATGDKEIRTGDDSVKEETLKYENGVETSGLYSPVKEGVIKKGFRDRDKEVEVGDDRASTSDSGVAISMRSQTGVSESPSTRWEKERRIKLGHRRVRSDGQVTYKDILTSRIVSSIQLGIEHATAGLAFRSDRDLLMQDFMTVESIPFSSPTTATAAGRRGISRFVFKTYAPVAFQYFRQLFGIRPEHFVASFCGHQLKELPGSGKSGSIFYLTRDDRFIVKTMQSKECSFLQNLLPGYYMNLHQNPDTLLPKYFGLYCYQCDMKKIKLVAMNNILPSSVKLSQRYDLKGATYKCRATKTDADVDADSDTDSDRPPTYKDLDFMLHHPSGLFLENETYNALMKTIKRDCTVLESFKIMDYSLLLGISSTPSPEPTKIHSAASSQSPAQDAEAGDESFLTATDPCASYSFPPGGLPALDGRGQPVLLFIGIIDILQSYKLKKKLEHAWKSVIHDGDTVSVHKPAFYSSRFQKFMSEKVFKRIPVPAGKRKAMKPAPVRKLRDYNACSSSEQSIHDF